MNSRLPRHFQYLGIAAALVCCGLLNAGAAEYFVAPQGDDVGDGLAWQTAFRTVQRGVDALAAGDTLTVAPGEYSEAVSRADLGSSDAATTIRALIPGTVRLRGDVATPEFKPVKGYRFIYSAEFDQPAQAVNELDTLSILEQEPSLSQLEVTPGAMHYDAEARKLYISTTDLQPPGTHRYSVSVLEGSGLRLDRPKRVTVEGIAFSGFNNRDRLVSTLTGSVSYIEAVRWGLLLERASQCVIRNCLASFNGGGLGIFSSEKAGGNEIAFSEAFANYSRFSAEGGNIHISYGNNDVVRDCVAYLGKRGGIRIYNQAFGPVLIERCLGWGNTGANISMKGGSMDKFGLATHSVALGKSSINTRVVSSLGLEVRRHAGTSEEENNEASENSIRVSREKNLRFEEEFADPANMDFRLQPKSRFRGAGAGGIDLGPHPYRADVFYVSPSGDDKADGLSVKTAWKSIGRAVRGLEGGHTLYVLPGKYTGDSTLRTVGELPVRICGRGETPAVFEGVLRIEGDGKVEISRLQFNKEVKADSVPSVTFKGCHFSGKPSGLSVRKGLSLRVENCAFSGFSKAGILLQGAGEIFLSSNIFDNQEGFAIETDDQARVVFSDYHSYRNGDKAWNPQAGESLLSAERHSRVFTPEWRREDGILRLANELDFVGAGALGRPQGPFRAPNTQIYSVTAPSVHSLSDTTANIEWTGSLPGTYELEWKTANGPVQKARIYSRRFCNYSLCDLQPDTEYSFRIRSIDAAESLEEKGMRVVAPRIPEPIRFRTAARPMPPKTYYVKAGGDDALDGLSPEAAWKTISHAASRVGPGDAVLIGDGVYKESVVIRATGTPQAPITFKAAPGARPVMDGDMRKLTTAFRLDGKKHVVVDGLSLVQFNCEGIAPEDNESGVFQIDRSSHVEIRRCFLDGRGKGYSAWFLAARNSDHVTVNNCVMVRCFNAVFLNHCADALIENCVFLRPQIAAVYVWNNPDEKLTFRRNILTDGNLNKATARMFNMNYLASLIEEANCYWMRLPAEQRMLYVGEVPKGGPAPDERGSISIAQYQKFYGKGGSLTLDPGFAVLNHLPPKKGKTDPRALAFDRLMDETEVPLDFEDLLATQPDVAQGGIGLDPAAFQDFPLKRMPLETAMGEPIK